jgi:membrane protein
MAPHCTLAETQVQEIFGVRLMTFGGLGRREVARQIFAGIYRDDVFDRAAELSFYFLMAIFPFLIFLSTVLGYFFAAQDDVYSRFQFYLQSLMPPVVSGFLQDTVREITRDRTGPKLTISLLLTLRSASSGMQSILEALNVAYRAKETRPWWRRRFTALALTVSLGLLVTLGFLLILTSSALSAGWGDISRTWNASSPGSRRPDNGLS